MFMRPARWPSRFPARYLAVAAVAAGTLAMAEPAPGSLEVAVLGVRSQEGSVRVALCPESIFERACSYETSVPARSGATVVTFAHVLPGRYAIRAYHDANANARFDRGLFGLPSEGFGFSKDPDMLVGRPRFEETAVNFSGAGERVAFRLRYVL